MKNILLFYNKWLEWIIRVIFTYDIIMPGLNYDSKVYPLNVLLALLVAFWLYSFRLKTLCLIFLLIAAFFNITHFNCAHCY